jgi:hypothetical protein
MMHGHEKSRSAIVAVKPTNKAEQSAAEPTAAESVERRAETKGNVDQQRTRRTQRRKRLLTTATFVLDFQRAGQAAARAGEAKTRFQGSSWAMRLIG